MNDGNFGVLIFLLVFIGMTIICSPLFLPNIVDLWKERKRKKGKKKKLKKMSYVKIYKPLLISILFLLLTCSGLILSAIFISNQTDYLGIYEKNTSYNTDVVFETTIDYKEGIRKELQKNLEFIIYAKENETIIKCNYPLLLHRVRLRLEYSSAYLNYNGSDVDKIIYNNPVDINSSFDFIIHSSEIIVIDGIKIYDFVYELQIEFTNKDSNISFVLPVICMILTFVSFLCCIGLVRKDYIVYSYNKTKENYHGGRVEK